MMSVHAHPCNFRLVRIFDRGWGELAFEYAWDMCVATSPPPPAPRLSAPFLDAFSSPGTSPPSRPLPDAPSSVGEGSDSAADTDNVLAAPPSVGEGGQRGCRVPELRGAAELFDVDHWSLREGGCAGGSRVQPYIPPSATGVVGCFLYELTAYVCDGALMDGGCLIPPNPPFRGWRLRNPTDGRTGPVGMERFDAAIGRAWDRHKLAGPIDVGGLRRTATIRAVQQYRFHCEMCCADAPVPGPAAGPHEILRMVRRVDGLQETLARLRPGAVPGEIARTEREIRVAHGAGKAARAVDHPLVVIPAVRPVGGAGETWRFEIAKHGAAAWLDLAGRVYAGDSAGIGFGPAWCAASGA